MQYCDKKKAVLFMNDIAASLSKKTYAFVVVAHIVSTSIPFIESISRYGKIIGIIPKPNSIDINVQKYFSDRGVNIIHLRREDISSHEAASNKLFSIIDDNKEIFVIDIGGYFSAALHFLNNFKNVVGIIEDTENGLKKYESILKNYSKNRIPIFSIARSRIKDFEDYLIGRAIANTVLDILTINSISYTDKQIGIIGFGEVGQGVAFYLRDMKNKHPFIFDHDSNVSRIVEMSGFKVLTHEDIIKKSDILICATGNKSINDLDLHHMRTTSFIASCTSPDDEFDFKEIDLSKAVDVGFKIAHLNGVHFLNNGNAVNFTFPSKQRQMLEPYIYLTHAALIQCAIEIERNENLSTQDINTLSANSEKKLIQSFRKKLNCHSDNTIFVERVLKSTHGKQNG